MSRQVSTFQLRLPRGPHEAVLERMAGHLSSVERHLHRALEGAVREAGGKVTDYKGAVMGPVHVAMQSRQIVAGNLRVSEALQKNIVASGYAAAY